MANQITGRTHIGRIPDNPLQELPNFVEAGESAGSIREKNIPTFIPIVRMDKPKFLRKIHSEDLNELLPSKTMISLDETVKIKDERNGTDFSIQPEIDKITDRENNIEKKAKGINVADNKNGSLTFTNYEGEKSIIPTGKKVQSTDGTVEVVENPNDFDLSIQEEINNRKEADAELQSRIEQETRSRTAAIDIERSRAVAKEDEIYTELELEIQKRKSEYVSLQSQLNNEIRTREFADANLQQQIDAFAGALIYIGTIDLPTSDVTQDALNQKANELGKEPILKGYVLVDNNSNDWWYDGTEWINIGYYDIAQATNNSLGVVKGSTANMKVSVDGLGEMSINNLQSALDGKQNKLIAGDNITINGSTISAGNSLTGNPLQLLHADGNPTPGFADVRHTLDGIYSDFPLVPNAIGYLIFMSSDSLTVGLLAITSQCSNNLLTHYGSRNNTSSSFTPHTNSGNNSWQLIAKDYYLKQHTQNDIEHITWQERNTWNNKQDKLTTSVSVSVTYYIGGATVEMNNVVMGNVRLVFFTCTIGQKAAVNTSIAIGSGFRSTRKECFTMQVIRGGQFPLMQGTLQITIENSTMSLSLYYANDTGGYFYETPSITTARCSGSYIGIL
jgi:hypothetical protein